MCLAGVVDVDAAEGAQPQMALIGYDGEDAADDGGEARVAVVGDDTVALHRELRDGGVVAQPYVALAADIVEGHVGRVEPVGHGGDGRNGARRVEGEAVEMADGSHPDVADTVLISSDAALTERLAQSPGQCRRGARRLLLLHGIEAQHTRVVVKGYPQAVVVVLHDILAGVAAQQVAAPLPAVEIVEGVAIVAYQATGTATHPHETVAVLIDVVDKVARQTIVHGQHVEMVALGLESAERCLTGQPDDGQGQQTEK